VKQQKVPFPALACAWLCAGASGFNIIAAEWFGAGFFALAGLLVLALIHVSEPAT